MPTDPATTPAVTAAEAGGAAGSVGAFSRWRAATVASVLVAVAVGLELVQVFAFVVVADDVLAAAPSGVGRVLLWPAPASTGGRVMTLAVELALARVARDVIPAPPVAVRRVTAAILFGTMLAASGRLTAVTVAVGVPLVWAVRQGRFAIRRAPSDADAARFAAALRLVEPLGTDITAIVMVCHRARLTVQAAMRRHHRVTFALLAGGAVAVGGWTVFDTARRTGLPPSRLAIFLAWPATLLAAPLSASQVGV